MEITLKNVFLVIFIALALASGTTKAEINFGRKIGFGTTQNQMIGNNEDDKIDTGVDSHHRYGSASRPDTGNYFMKITLKNVFLMIFIALVLASGTTKAEINFGRKIGFGTTKNQMIGNNEDDKIDTGVDSHHSYGSTGRPDTGN
ncbi:hypothetical protein E3N88_16101 [Mikania micrantha]|uniref:Uncharacterized protein n=1 Tax=Mikania micrantha TaxID=192012 RepID=A0A5N6NZ69_9ASTR|nr:hypothetical protein E3N88_16101 [Mikania micrantha]